MLYGFGAMPSSFSGDPGADAAKAAKPGCGPGFKDQGGVCLPEWLGSPAYAAPASPAYATPASPAYATPIPGLVAGQGGGASSGEKKFLGLPAKLLGLPMPVVLLGVGSILLLGVAMMRAKQKPA